MIAFALNLIEMGWNIFPDTVRFILAMASYGNLFMTCGRHAVLVRCICVPVANTLFFMLCARTACKLLIHVRLKFIFFCTGRLSILEEARRFTIC